jgi:CP family cyanate transporter-like MFS transporter
MDAASTAGRALVGDDPPVEPAAPAGAMIAVLGLIGFNLRASFGAIPPLLGQIEHTVPLSSFAQGLLTALPVAVMGLLAPPAQRLAARIGPERATGAALGLLSAAELMRLGGADPLVLFASTVLAGAGMGGVTTLMPGLVGHYVPRRPGLATGVYSTTMATGSAVAAWIAVPVAASLGAWQRSLASWGVCAALTTICWFLLLRHRARGSDRAAPPVISAPGAHRLPWRSGTAWLLTGFVSLQTLMGYSGIAWISPTYRRLGWSAQSAGSLLSLFFAVQILTMLVLPALTDRSRDRRGLLAIATLSTSCGWALLALAPRECAVLAIVTLGAGVGGGFSLGLVLLVDSTDNRIDAARLAAMVFLVSYLVASLGPLLVGALNQLTGSSVAGFLALLSISLVDAALGLAMRPGRRLAAAA